MRIVNNFVRIISSWIHCFILFFFVIFFLDSLKTYIFPIKKKEVITNYF